jgi:hypothetical protein
MHHSGEEVEIDVGHDNVEYYQFWDQLRLHVREGIFYASKFSEKIRTKRSCGCMNDKLRQTRCIPETLIQIKDDVGTRGIRDA